MQQRKKTTKQQQQMKKTTRKKEDNLKIKSTYVSYFFPPLLGFAGRAHLVLDQDL